MEHKLFTPQFKLSDDGAGALEGYASTFLNWDSVRERPVKGAFTAHLADFLKDGFIAIGHDWSGLPIATPVEAREDDHGLFVKAAFHSTPEAQQARTVVRERIERGKSVKLSIGYEVLDDDYTQEGRLLKDIKLYEWSIVTVPANDRASVTFAKALPPEGAPLDIYKAAAEAALTALVRESLSLEERRIKAGRMISEANVKVMNDALTSMEEGINRLRDLLARATEPKADPAKEALRLFAEFQQIESSLLGVPRP